VLVSAEFLITTTKPHLIVMTGDTVTGLKSGLFAQIAIEFFYSFGIPHPFVLGNHDGEEDEDKRPIAERFLIRPGTGSIHGYSNSAINLVNSAGWLIYSVVLLDSNREREYFAPSSGHDSIYRDQGMLYSWLIKGLSVSCACWFRGEGPEGAARPFCEQPC
jgi:hypothetical protein